MDLARPLAATKVNDATPLSGMSTKTDPPRDGVAASLVHAHRSHVIGVLHGFDRLRLQGTLRSLYHPEVMVYYLRRAGVLWKDFKTFATGLTDRVRQAAVQLAQTHRRPVIYLPGRSTSKEEVARHVAARDRLTAGLVAVLSCVEPCRTWFARGNRATQKLELKLQWGKCLHLYFYFVHEQLGWLHLRLQTWFPCSLSNSTADSGFTEVHKRSRNQVVIGPARSCIQCPTT